MYFSKLCIVRQTITGLGLVDKAKAFATKVHEGQIRFTVVNNFAWNFL